MSAAIARQEEAAIVPQDRQLDAIKRILSQRTPQSEIRYRKGRGEKRWAYTDGAYVIRTLNEAFGWDWDFVADSEELLMNNGKPSEVKCRGTLTVRMGGRSITKTQYGCQPIENGPSVGDCYKGAATDAMKKCASLLGIALDLYDSDYKAEKYAEPEPQPVKQVKLEGAQPSNQHVGPKTQEILNWMRDMGWNANDLANYIYLQFDKLAVDDTDVLKAMAALSGPQKKALHQMVEAEWNNRKR